ncbi:MAG TPA: hypothetical protein VF590_27580, partial [Isosphaeraceae bacterium]
MAGGVPSPITLDGSASLRLEGQIEVDSDVHSYPFTVPYDGLFAVRMEAGPGSDLDTFLEIHQAGDDGAIAFVASNDDIDRGDFNSRVFFHGRAGTVYNALAGSSGASHGPYTLTFEVPRLITPAASGPTVLSPDTIEEESDLDLFRFVAPASGNLDVRLDGTAGSGLRGALTVFDVSRRVTIGSEEDEHDSARDGLMRLDAADDADGVRDGVVRVAAVAGQTYVVAVSSFRHGSTGAYTLSLVPSESLPDLPDPRPIALPSSGPATQPASIDVAGDVDTFRFVAPGTGSVTIRQDAFLGSGLDSHLSVF